MATSELPEDWQEQADFEVHKEDYKEAAEKVDAEMLKLMLIAAGYDD